MEADRHYGGGQRESRCLDERRSVAALVNQEVPLRIAGRDFRSRLIMGTGKFASGELMAAALAASGAELVTVALRRVDLTGGKDKFANILTFLDSAVSAFTEYQWRSNCRRSLPACPTRAGGDQFDVVEIGNTS